MKKTSCALVLGSGVMACLYRMYRTSTTLERFLELCTENPNYGVVGVGINVFGNFVVTVNPGTAREALPTWFGSRHVIVSQRSC